MNRNFASKVLQYVEVNSALLKRALDELGVHRQAQKRAADQRADLLKRMVEVGCVQESQKTAADAMLGGHAETMGLLKAAVDKIAGLREELSKRAGDLGQGADPKEFGSEKAAFDSLSDGYVGRKTSQRKASDEAILKVLHQ
jgi:hypothetical protein